LDRVYRQRADRIDAQLIKRLTHRFLPVLTGKPAQKLVNNTSSTFKTGGQHQSAFNRRLVGEFANLLTHCSIVGARFNSREWSVISHASSGNPGAILNLDCRKSHVG
jgi:hypothetical protein